MTDRFSALNDAHIHYGTAPDPSVMDAIGVLASSPFIQLLVALFLGVVITATFKERKRR